MKAIHLMKEEKFTKGICEFYNNFFNNGLHEICYLIKSSKSEINHNISIPQQELIKGEEKFMYYLRFIKIIKRYDYVIVHSMMTLDNYMKLLLLPYHKKMIWIEWGADLYDWEPKGKCKFLTKRINRILREKCFRVICIFPPDVDYYKLTFEKSKAKVFYAPYQTSTIGKQYLFHLNNPIQRKEGSPIHILVGHSATRQINHLAILEKLHSFANENILISIPLSYGDKEYAQEVIKKAKSLFSIQKLNFLVNFLSEDDYYLFLNSIDIAIFETDRQIALGNIIPLILQGTKVFLKDNSVMYEYFLENGVPIQKTEDINKVSFSEFICCKQIPDTSKYNLFVNNFVNTDYVVSLWKKAYNFLDENE